MKIIRAYTKHNLTNHRLYNILKMMKQRVYNKKHTNYDYYGGRGITICDEWRNDFMSFYNWSIENGYQEDLTIDRINVNGNYEPSNCRWATRAVQSRNTKKIRSSNTSGYRGVYFEKRRNLWRATIDVNNKTISIGFFKTALEASKAYDLYVIKNNLEHTTNEIICRKC